LIYLDNNATTQMEPEVANHVAELLHARLANPSSQHAHGRAARKILEQARDRVLISCRAQTQGMASDSCLFTSGGTESNNLALFGLAESRPGAIVVSNIEHPSILAAAQRLECIGREVRILPSLPSGITDIEPLRRWIEVDRAPIALVSVMSANNETGVMQPIESVVSLCRTHGIYVHSDAVQALGKVPLDFHQLQLDAMTITAHKLHGPLGIGALILKHGVSLAPYHFGGFQQLGLRPGTEMPALASGFAMAAQMAVSDLPARSEHMLQLRRRFESLLHTQFDTAVILGDSVSRLPHTLSVAFPGVDRQALQMALDQAGIACSTGSACASGSSQPSHVLQAMHVPTAVLAGAIRFSLSHETTESEVDQTVRALTSILPRLTKRPD